MKLTFLKGVVLGSVVAVVTLTATSAIAGTGIGAVFNLGKTNSVNATSHLKGNAAGPMLAVKNKGTGTALSLSVGKGGTPFTVNSTTRVANLNASLLGGLGPNNFVQGGGQARAYAITVTGEKENVPLLSIPGFGSLSANCVTEIAADANILYSNGSRTVDVWTDASGQKPTLISDLQPHKRAVATDSLAVLPGDVPDDLGWGRVIIHYTVKSGFFFIPLIATVNVFAAVTHFGPGGPTCKFVAEALAGTGQVLP